MNWNMKYVYAKKVIKEVKKFFGKVYPVHSLGINVYMFSY